ncbi:MAG: tyrosine-type recombinase/integrase [Candidatus Bathyarchaeia archaeon]
MREIPKEAIVQIFNELSQTELKPYQMTPEGFLTIPEVLQFKQALEKRQVSILYLTPKIHRLRHLCIHLGKHPRHLTIEECSEFLIKLKQQKIPGLNYHETKQVIRLWFQLMHGINSEILTSKGIDGAIEYELGSKSHERLTRKQRHAFINALKEIIENNKDQKPFIDAWISLPYFLYYTATRIRATLNANIEDIEKYPNKWIITVIDKGRHKKGRKKWRKIIIGELKEKLQKNLESRGNPKEGKLFPFTYHKVREIFFKAYKKANIPKPQQPCHIWRHTAAQDFLEATNWNYELCIQTLGWEDTRTLKKCYGAISEHQKEMALRKAMGEPIKETKKQFRF